MAFSVNKVMLLGNLGQDAEIRFTTDNTSVTKFSLATSRSYKKGEEWVNETTWHNIVAWNLSDYYKEALKKGKKVFIEGRISKRDYTDKDNIKRYFTEVVAEKIIPLDPRESGEQAGGVVSEPQQSAPDDPDNDLPF